jgi:hypothetical protein
MMLDLNKSFWRGFEGTFFQKKVPSNPLSRLSGQFASLALISLYKGVTV